MWRVAKSRYKDEKNCNTAVVYSLVHPLNVYASWRERTWLLCVPCAVVNQPEDSLFSTEPRWAISLQSSTMGRNNLGLISEVSLDRSLCEEYVTNRPMSTTGQTHQLKDEKTGVFGVF